MANFQRYEAIGRLARDPKVASTPDGRLTTFVLVVNDRQAGAEVRGRDSPPTYVDCEAYNRPGGRPLADEAAKLSAGDELFLEGRLRTYTAEVDCGRAQPFKYRKTALVVTGVEHLTRPVAGARYAPMPDDSP